MPDVPRDWWRNCAVQVDTEILAIDRIEDRISPVDPNAVKVRGLISTLELCHHKAKRWIVNIIEAIGVGITAKGLGTRGPDERHPIETVWENACVSLSAWCAGASSDSIDISIGGVPASELLAGLGERSALKEWQVQRAVAKVGSMIRWPRSEGDPTSQYRWILLGGGEYELAYQDRCPEYYQDHEDFWLTTVKTMIHDTLDGREAQLSLGLAIDMLWPCHQEFIGNLRIVLNAIGGDLHPEKPFAACGRNIASVVDHPYMETVCKTLQAFYGTTEAEGDVDQEFLATLGEPTPTKRWLAMSFDKTIRLQLDLSAELRAMSALEGPAWIRA